MLGAARTTRLRIGLSARVLVVRPKLGQLRAAQRRAVVPRTLPTRTFSILISLEPVAAALSGWPLLGERLLYGQWLAVGFIVVTSVGATLTAGGGTPAIVGE